MDFPSLSQIFQGQLTAELIRNFLFQFLGIAAGFLILVLAVGGSYRLWLRSGRVGKSVYGLVTRSIFSLSLQAFIAPGRRSHTARF